MLHARAVSKAAPVLTRLLTPLFTILERVAPSAMKMDYPRLPRREAARAAPQSFELVGSEDRRLDGT